MQFKLFDSATVGTGTQQGSAITDSAVQVTNGVFTVQLDFGTGIFDGSARFLEIGIRPAGSPAPLTILSPRQPMSSSPYAVRSATAGSADTATNAGQLGGMSPGGFIQNTNTQQPGTSFNIGGTGTANILNAATQFNLNGLRILSNAGDSNLFAGIGAGAVNTGSFNSFFGSGAGVNNTTGAANSFFGKSAGQTNTTGGNNSFFGTSAGQANTTAIANSFFGAFSGSSNTTGSSNSFFGQNAGHLNTTGIQNSFFGRSAGSSNTIGGSNSFFGVSAGGANSTGGTNSFFGHNAGVSNTTGDSNSFFGQNAGFSNSTAFRNSFFGQSAGQNNTTGCCNAFFGTFAGQLNTTGGINSFFGYSAGFNNTIGQFNSFFGQSAGSNTTAGSNNTFIGANAGNPDIATQVSNSTAIGIGATVTTNNTIVLGRNTETTRIPGKLVTSKIIMGAGPVESGGVAQTFDTGTIQGIFAANLVLYDINDILASPVHLCIRSTSLGGFGGEALARCSTSSSPSQYKTNLQPFLGGLDVINRLKPMTFTWKDGGKRDFGLNAEDVAEVEPLLVTRNDKGEIEDVNEASFNVLFINAFKEQEQQIRTLKQQIESFKRIVCLDHPDAPICK
jgi:hypothetical protein